MRKNFILVFSVTFLFLGCSRQSPRQEISEFYDIEGLFLSQINSLKNRPFTKSAVIDQKAETAIVRLDTAEWKKELSMFIGLDINKAALVGAYEKNTLSVGSGQVMTYNLKPGEDSSVKMIKIGKDSTGLVTSLEGLFSESNILYQNQRQLHARFGVEKDQPVLRSYSVKGFQKIILKDTVHYSIEADISAKDS